MEVEKWIWDKKKEEFTVERTRARIEEEERRWRSWVNLERFMKELKEKKKFRELRRNLG